MSLGDHQPGNTDFDQKKRIEVDASPTRTLWLSYLPTLFLKGSFIFPRNYLVSPKRPTFHHPFPFDDGILSWILNISPWEILTFPECLPCIHEAHTIINLFGFHLLIFYYKGSQPRTQKGREKINFSPLHCIVTVTVGRIWTAHIAMCLYNMWNAQL